eukprot:TRINITY_DN7835_c0_g2_i4.p1 TRINITY_DN7835_c0_g2~~TRINITY_DN7835_c0_g2_i4.p1  ORF type:complete len:406 (-),score=113.73 TRINITY_DN7835_c0_g2_i4:32-1249(-)
MEMLMARIFLQLHFLSTNSSKKIANLVKNTLGTVKTPLGGWKDSWGDVNSLQSFCSDEEVEFRCSSTSSTVHLLFKSLDLPCNLSQEDIKRLVRIVMMNGHEINPKQLGIGLYPTGAVFNHSCAPNLGFSHNNEGLLCFRALKDIPMGIELCSSYIDIIASKSTRRLQLKSRYDFECKCERCESGEDEDLLKGYLCPNKSSCKEVSMKIDEKDTNCLICTQCNQQQSRFIYKEAERKVEGLQRSAMEKSSLEDYSSALGDSIKALSAGSSLLHPSHELNFTTYQCLAVACNELGKSEQSVKFARKELELVKKLQVAKVVGGSCASLYADKYRKLALYLQDLAQSQVSDGKNASKTIEESLLAFKEASKFYDFHLGDSHWYSIILQKVVKSFDDSNSDALNVWDYL